MVVPTVTWIRLMLVSVLLRVRRAALLCLRHSRLPSRLCVGTFSFVVSSPPAKRQHRGGWMLPFGCDEDPAKPPGPSAYASSRDSRGAVNRNAWRMSAQKQDAHSV